MADKRTNSVVVTADELTVDRIRKLVATSIPRSSNLATSASFTSSMPTRSRPLKY
ncbi:MAG: hypothetical protein CM15mP89_1640 [Gammaproteobacteria bacterium]|nr:MAG: hypothetical protein CM15mP89_1640 [Gammaproteobacteria bacterium]